MLKRTIVTLGVVGLVACASYGQGTVNFNTSVAGTQSQVRDAVEFGGGLVGSGANNPSTGSANTNFLAQLYAGASSSSLVAVGNPVNFRRGAGAGWNQFSGTTTLGWAVIPEVGITGVALGGPAEVQLRAWWAGPSGTTYTTYESAFAAQGSDLNMRTGVSPILSLAATGGGGSPPGVAVGLIGLQGFQLVVVPEPTTFALAGLGAAALLLFRRRK